MIVVVKKWGERYFSDPQAILLVVLLGGSILLLMTMGKILAPVLTSIVIAYLLNWLAEILIRRKMPRSLALALVYGGFLGLFLSAIFILWPILWQQLLKLYAEMPSMVTNIQHFLYLLPEKFPQFLTKDIVDNSVAGFLEQLKSMGKNLFAASLASLPTLMAFIIYLVLVPIMVFFLLKDHQKIMQWLANFLPEEKQLLVKVWSEVDEQIGNYIRGKVGEIILVGMVTYLVFSFFGMHYSALLALLVGVSVLIPYVGAVVVTIPVVLVAFFQWGLDAHFAYLMVAYGIIHTLDGAILVPLLFSEAVNLHPVAIIVAVLVFGGWWGFWGLFFAIPLATLVKAVITAWPRGEQITVEVRDRLPS